MQPHFLANFLGGQNWLDLGKFGWIWEKFGQIKARFGKIETKFGQK